MNSPEIRHNDMYRGANYMSVFNKQLRNLMQEIGTNSEKLSLVIGVSSSVICRWTKNDASTSLKNGIKLADYFQCSLDYLYRFAEDDLKTSFLPCPDFYTQLTAFLKKEHISLYRICKDTSLPVASFARWKNGSDPKMSSLIILASYLKISLDTLVGRE